MAERDPNANEAAEEFEESDPKGQPSTEEEAPNPLSAEDKSPELGEDEHEKAANKFLRALATAGRSFLLYDTKNDAIHGFLDNLNGTAIGYNTSLYRNKHRMVLVFHLS